MSLGLKCAGIDVVGAYDAWDPAVETYCHNVGRHVHKHDLKDIFAVAPTITRMAPDLIAGGPPCQDYSVAGKRVEGENASLTRAFAMLVCLARPQWFVMENVPQAARSEAWADGRKMLVRAGYGLSECRLDDLPEMERSVHKRSLSRSCRSSGGKGWAFQVVMQWDRLI
ncbi:DNA cytosine methyltransferase [Ochrobactrum vermis]|uniref:DNA (cytosine-5-)-methyltransferase n=1 Tax=Ochrobactrum vermis TaxID=1827297 RepID=A0ABU8PL19_9HYPH|nr:DNA cytosine methyltransferase [Ochrobactrum vermis]